MQRREFTYPSADGKTQIHAVEWKPDGDVCAILQISHGMQEYIGRYDGFAQFLTGHGFLVTGNDHLGHGASVISEEEHGYFGEPDGNRYVIADIHTLRAKTQAAYPDVPYLMLGHSMGSFLLRQYLTMYAGGLAGAVIMGTGAQPQAALTIGKLCCRLIGIFRGRHYRSSFVNNLAIGGYNKKFQPARTPNDWLTKDTAVVDAYCADPWCTFMFTVNAYYHMFRGIEAAQKGADRIPKTLPLLVASGADDPVGGFGTGVREVYEGYQKSGMQDVSLRLYETDRHEILNETDRQTVYADILAWLKAKAFSRT